MGARAGIGGFMRAGIRRRAGRTGPPARGLAARRGALGRSRSDRRSPDRFVITGPLLVAAGRSPGAGRARVRGSAPSAPPRVRGDRARAARRLRLRRAGPRDALARAAVAGRPVTLPLVVLAPAGDRVDADLEPVADRGRPVARGARDRRLSRRGAPARRHVPDRQARGGVAFLPGIYPHHALALDERRRRHIPCSSPAARIARARRSAISPRRSRRRARGTRSCSTTAATSGCCAGTAQARARGSSSRRGRRRPTARAPGRLARASSITRRRGDGRAAEASRRVEAEEKCAGRVLSQRFGRTGNTCSPWIRK